MTNKTRSTEIKLKISKTKKGTKCSEETKRKMSAAFTGRKHSEKTKLKIGKGNKEKKQIAETRKKISKAHIGKRKSAETKKKMSLARIGKKHSEKTKIKLSLSKTGENNPAWQGGISYEPYCDVWLDKEYKQSIRDRDNNTCQNPDCRKNCDHLPLTVHHIDYIKKNCVPKNLITLCCSCNFRANKNRKERTVFYQNIIKQKYKLKETAHV